MKTEIIINNVARETEKAVLVNLNVTFNHNGYKAREVWMPKSVISVDGCIAKVEDWFLRKLSVQNAFHGYTMSFERPLYV